VAGVPFGLFLSDWFGVQAPFYAIALLSALLWLVVLATLRPGEAVEEPRAVHAGAVLAQPACVLGFLLSFCVVFAGFLLIPYLGTFMQRNLGLGTADLPWVYASGGLFTLLTSRVTGRLVDRLGPARVLLALLLATAIPHLAFTHLQEASLARVCGWFVLFMGLTAVRIIPTLALITSALPVHARGRFMALNTAVTDLATALATWLGGALLAQRADGALIGFGKLGYLAVLMSSGAVLVLWLVRRAQAREPGQSATERLKAIVE
jgi:MFS transporter, DHA1 family, inner membrane transport protein